MEIRKRRKYTNILHKLGLKRREIATALEVKISLTDNDLSLYRKKGELEYSPEGVNFYSLRFQTFADLHVEMNRASDLFEDWWLYDFLSQLLQILEALKEAREYSLALTREILAGYPHQEILSQVFCLDVNEVPFHFENFFLNYCYKIAKKEVEPPISELILKQNLVIKLIGIYQKEVVPFWKYSASHTISRCLCEILGDKRGHIVYVHYSSLVPMYIIMSRYKLSRKEVENLASSGLEELKLPSSLEKLSFVRKPSNVLLKESRGNDEVGHLFIGTIEPLLVSVYSLGLSVRVKKCFGVLGVDFLGDLIQISEASLFAANNFGRLSLEEVKDVLQRYGLLLGTVIEEDQLARYEAEKQIKSSLKGACYLPK